MASARRTRTIAADAASYLQRQWHEGDRNFFEYSMGSTSIADFFAYISARYKVRHEYYKGTKLEVYYTEQKVVFYRSPPT
jgi:ABC-2 type transport system permease protein